ncbi:MAG: aminopeptidase [Candidatus Heimdallarchaeota archaeon]
MVTQQEIRKCSQAIVDCINVKKGDGVVVQGWLHQKEILEEILIGLYERGAIPYLNMSWDRIEQRKMETIDANILELAPRHKTELFQAMDAFIGLEPYEDPAIQHNFPREKITAAQKSSGPLRDILYDEKDGKKWLYAGWPTKQAAQMYGIEFEDLERFTIGGMMVPVSELKEKCAALGKLLTHAAAIHVWDSQGSDFVAEVTDRSIVLDNGIITQEKYERNERGANLPAGEVFIAPHEEKGSGTIYSPLTRDRFSNKIIKNVNLTFEDGRLQLDKCTAGENGDQLFDTFEKAIKMDEERYGGQSKALNIAELGIGLNNAITKAIGYILTDEKIGGTVHVAFGNNSSFGGISKSNLHWDFVSAVGVSIKVTYKDGSSKLIMEDGKMLK